MAKKRELPKISVLDRRKLHPFGAPGVPITLRDGGAWALRIINTKMKVGRYHEVVHAKGWVPVLPEELDGTPDEYGFAAKDGRLVRGEHSEEILMKMPQKDYDEIADAKARKNLEGMTAKKSKQTAVDATAAQFGDEAAESVNRSNMTVEDSRVTMELEETPK